MDDGTLGGSKEDVLHDLDVVECEGADLGLCLNNQKSEVICDDIDTKDALLLSLQGARVVDPLEASLLGSSLGDVSSISTSLREKITLLESMGGRLKFLFTHDALLLRHSFAIPKLLYNLRTSPCFLSPVLQEYDNLLKSIVSDTVNIYFCEDDPAWIQATLPVRCGGLGIRSAVQLAPSSFLVSAAASLDLVHRIVPSHLHGIPLPYLPDAMAQWSDGHDDLSPPEGTARRSQRVWDTLKVSVTAERLLENAPDLRACARLLAASSRESGAWLQAHPVSSLGLRMDDNTIRVAVGLRLGSPLCRPHI